MKTLIYDLAYSPTHAAAESPQKILAYTDAILQSM
jgi:hypothetical protein